MMPSRPAIQRPSALPEAVAAADASAVWEAPIEQIPRRFRGHDLATVGALLQRREAVPEAIAALEQLLLGRLLTVTLVGRSECGKTSLAAAMLRELCRLAVDGSREARRLTFGSIWGDALKLNNARRSHRLGDGDAPLVERCKSVGLLVLDDVGQETAQGADEILDVLWRRHQEDLPTILTTC